jgi:hypothetical protein
VITNNGESDSTSAPKKSITKPKAFTEKATHPVSSLNNILVGQHHRFETRIGFLSPFEEQEIFDIIDQLRPKTSFEEAEQSARRRFEHILCLNLNKTNVDIPQECKFNDSSVYISLSLSFRVLFISVCSSNLNC